MTTTSQFSDMMLWSICFWSCFVPLVKFSYWSKFMSISSSVLELWRFSFISDWPEIRRSEIPPSAFWLISGDWAELGIPNLARMSLIKCYWMLQKARVTAFTISELSWENQQGEGVKFTPSPYPPRLELILKNNVQLLESLMTGYLQNLPKSKELATIQS